MNYTDEKIVKSPRIFFPEDLDVTKWENVEKEMKKLEDEKINSADELIKFMEKIGELSDIMEEEIAWRYITMTRFADNKENEKKFNEYYSGVIAKAKPFNFKFNKKFYDSPFRKELDAKKYALLNKIISNDIELYREENIPLKVKEKELANKYGAIFSKLTVKFKGEEKTLPQLAVYAKDQDRKVREQAWKLKVNKMKEHRDEFNKLFDDRILPLIFNSPIASMKSRI